MNREFAERLKLLKDFWSNSSGGAYFLPEEEYAHRKEHKKKQEKQRDVLIKALDVFLICPVVFKKGADVLKFPVVKCEHIRMYRLKDISCCSWKIYNLTPVTFYSFIGEFLSLLKRVYWG